MDTLTTLDFATRFVGFMFATVGPIAGFLAWRAGF